MNEASSKPRDPFFNLASWLSLIVPFATVAAVYGLQFTPHSWQTRGMVVVEGALFFILNSLVLGIVSLFGLPRRGAGQLWRGLLGILASVGIGFCFVVILLLFETKW